MTSYLPEIAIVELLKLREDGIKFRKDKIEWVMISKDSRPHTLFTTLSKRNQNLVLLLASTMMERVFRTMTPTKVTELLSIKNEFDTTTEHNVMVILRTLLIDGGGNMPWDILFNDIARTNIHDLLNNDSSLRSGILNVDLATITLFALSMILVIDVEYDGNYPLLSERFNETKGKNIDEIINILYSYSRLPRVEKDYFTNDTFVPMN